MTASIDPSKVNFEMHLNLHVGDSIIIMDPDHPCHAANLSTIPLVRLSMLAVLLQENYVAVTNAVNIARRIKERRIDEHGGATIIPSNYREDTAKPL